MNCDSPLWDVDSGTCMPTYPAVGDSTTAYRKTLLFHHSIPPAKSCRPPLMDDGGNGRFDILSHNYTCNAFTAPNYRSNRNPAFSGRMKTHLGTLIAFSSNNFPLYFLPVSARSDKTLIDRARQLNEGRHFL